MPYNKIIFFYISALIADQTGSYVYSFYMTGGVLLTAFLIPVILVFLNRAKSNLPHHVSEAEAIEEEMADTISDEIKALDQVLQFERRLRAGTLPRMRSASTNV